MTEAPVTTQTVVFEDELTGNISWALSGHSAEHLQDSPDLVEDLKSELIGGLAVIVSRMLLIASVPEIGLDLAQFGSIEIVTNESFTVENEVIGKLIWTPGNETQQLLGIYRLAGLGDTLSALTEPDLVEAAVEASASLCIADNPLLSMLKGLASADPALAEAMIMSLLDDELGEEATTLSGVEVFYLGETPDGPDPVEAEAMIAADDLR